jgi:hypothetical protein
MPTANCPHCNADHDWSWEEAFNKFGFDDGDGLVKTDVVAAVLTAAGYTVKSHTWGMHNTIIDSVACDGTEQIPASAELGYDDPRCYLPARIVELLDGADYEATEETLRAESQAVQS